MAVVWQKQHGECLYEVRNAGKSIRLYTNGVFHSQWNPNVPLSGHLWDLLYLPALFHPHYKSMESVCILGLGGGAVVNLFNRFSPPKVMTAVDLDKEHIKIAKRFFLSRCPNVKLVHENALNYIAEQPHKHGFILEDLFCGEEDDPASAIRAVEMTEKWLCSLSRRLQKTGVLSVNFESARQLRACLTKASVAKAGFNGVYQLMSPRYENAVAVCIKGQASLQSFKANIAEFSAEQGVTVIKKLEYSLKKIH